MGCLIISESAEADFVCVAAVSTADYCILILHFTRSRLSAIENIAGTVRT